MTRSRTTTRPDNFEFDLLVYIGRFQPLHAGHVSVLEDAGQRARFVLNLIGSANEFLPRTRKNPFTYYERAQMNREAFGCPDWLLCAALEDRPSNDDWAAGVRQITKNALGVIGVTTPDFNMASPRVGITGFNKDESSFYLDLFPEWTRVEAKNYGSLSATEIREAYFRSVDECLDTYGAELPVSVHTFLLQFATTEAYARLRAEP